jgi:hypothetical protein
MEKITKLDNELIKEKDSGENLKKEKSKLEDEKVRSKRKYESLVEEKKNLVKQA